VYIMIFYTCQIPCIIYGIHEKKKKKKDIETCTVSLLQGKEKKLIIRV
jgi:hypothetical protein